jgi:hypothetical protein
VIPISLATCLGTSSASGIWLAGERRSEWDWATDSGPQNPNE